MGPGYWGKYGVVKQPQYYLSLTLYYPDTPLYRIAWGESCKHSRKSVSTHHLTGMATTILVRIWKVGGLWGKSPEVPLNYFRII